MGRVKWRIMADWGGDGSFGGANADITGDALGFSLAHERDLGSEHIGAARLRLTLRNDGHRYSPPNAASPLSGSLAPGRGIWLRGAFPCDEFGGAAGAALGGRAPTFGAAYRWADPGGGFALASGGGARTAGAAAGARVATVDFAYPDASFGCDFTRGGGANHGGLALRYSDANNYLHLRATGAAIELRKVEAGRDAAVAAAPLRWDVGERRFIEAALHGDSIAVFVDGGRVLSARTGFNAGATRHGLRCAGAAAHRWHDFGGWASLFRGALDAIDPVQGGGARRCVVSASDEMGRMSAAVLYTYASAAFPQTSRDILAKILDYAGVDAAARRLDRGTELVPSMWSPPMWGVSAAECIRRLQDEEDGFVYVDGRGDWRLEGRGHRGEAPHATNRAVLTDSDDGVNPYFSALEWRSGGDNVENKVVMRFRDATNRGIKEVWALGETPYFDANETRDFLAESEDYDAVGGVLRPLPRTDYTANAQADGRGADLTAQVSASLPSSDYSGKGTMARVRFGAAPGYLTRLRLRSFNAMTYNAPTLAAAESAGSVAARGQRVKRIDAHWTRQAHVAQATAAHRLARRAQPRAALRVEVRGGSDANTMLALQAGLSDRVGARYAAMGVDGAFFVEGHRLEVGGGGSAVKRVLLLREA